MIEKPLEELSWIEGVREIYVVSQEGFVLFKRGESGEDVAQTLVGYLNNIGLKETELGDLEFGIFDGEKMSSIVVLGKRISLVVFLESEFSLAFTIKKAKEAVQKIESLI
ncbi:hypothetical protein B6U74_06225 [Candidatus Bathyarchaeota archaeon ex4484_205]|nr:MAG: hypothetical protein B6U74_06225 [Candidatus Bathyarchaeota archaeon ex4484_205]RLF90837.1 MAG: hypothetical protein DRN46_02670 [Thermococci archaeon]RLF96924.1 MAG: hypothetical protein DRN52_01600 [Thermococci archaeon]HDI10605.1 hypothetical protein [Euryarchaeota archaeon]